MLEQLQGGPVAVRDTLGLIEVESSTLSQQLTVLRRAGIVTAARDGVRFPRLQHRPDAYTLALGPCHDLVGVWSIAVA